MEIRSTTVLFLLAAVTSGTLMSAEASSKTQTEADTSPVGSLSVINGESPHTEGECVSAPLVTAPAIEEGPTLSLGLPFGAQARTGGSCLCSQDLCCGCNPD